MMLTKKEGKAWSSKSKPKDVDQRLTALMRTRLTPSPTTNPYTHVKQEAPSRDLIACRLVARPLAATPGSLRPPPNQPAQPSSRSH